MKPSNYFRKISLTAGIGYLVIFFTGIYANFFILDNLVVKDNAATTWKNILDNFAHFRMGILSFIIMVIFDLVLTWALYVLLQATNKELALFAAWFRLVNCILFSAALVNLFDVMELTRQSTYWAAGSKEYLQTEVMLSLSTFNYTWLLGLVFFGIHLMALGILVFRSGFIPKFIGTLLLLAGTGYLMDSFAQLIMKDYVQYQILFTMLVIIPAVVGELIFTIWLLFKGGLNHHQRMK